MQIHINKNPLPQSVCSIMQTLQVFQLNLCNMQFLYSHPNPLCMSAIYIVKSMRYRYIHLYRNTDTEADIGFNIHIKPIPVLIYLFDTDIFLFKSIYYHNISLKAILILATEFIPICLFQSDTKTQYRYHSNSISFPSKSIKIFVALLLMLVYIYN